MYVRSAVFPKSFAPPPLKKARSLEHRQKHFLFYLNMTLTGDDGRNVYSYEVMHQKVPNRRHGDDRDGNATGRDSKTGVSLKQMLHFVA